MNDSMGQANYDLAAEALVLTTGIFPDSLTAADGKEAAELPRVWYRQCCDFLRSERPERWRMFAQPDSEKTYLRLRQPIDTEALTVDMEDPGLVTAYVSKLEEARRYVEQLWPVLQIQRFLGAVFVQPSMTALGEAHSVLALLGHRDRLTHELASGALTHAQAEAFRGLFPATFEMVQGFLRYERERMIRAKDDAPYWVESVLRTLLDLPPEAEMTSPADDVPAPPPPSMPSLDINFAAQATRAQRLDNPDA